MSKERSGRPKGQDHQLREIASTELIQSDTPNVRTHHCEAMHPKKTYSNNNTSTMYSHQPHQEDNIS